MERSHASRGHAHALAFGGKIRHVCKMARKYSFKFSSERTILTICSLCVKFACSTSVLVCLRVRAANFAVTRFARHSCTTLSWAEINFCRATFWLWAEFFEPQSVSEQIKLKRLDEPHNNSCIFFTYAHSTYSCLCVFYWLFTHRLARLNFVHCFRSIGSSGARNSMRQNKTPQRI